MNHIIVCGGMRCQLNGSKAYKQEFERLIAEKGLLNETLIYFSGCCGLCRVGPAVNLFVDGLGKFVYVNVKFEDISRIVEETIVNKKIIPELLLENNFDPNSLDPSKHIK